MGVLDALGTDKVFYYFEEITKIPHGSGNEAALHSISWTLPKKEDWNAAEMKRTMWLLRKLRHLAMNRLLA